MAAGDVDIKITTTNGKGCDFFNGLTSYVQIPHDGRLLGSGLEKGFTISLWVMVYSLGESNLGRIVDKSDDLTATNGFAVITYPINKFGLYMNNLNKGSADNSIIFNTWQHLCITLSSVGLVNFYIDNVLSGGANQNLGVIPSSVSTEEVLRLGNPSVSTTRAYSGLEKDFRFWNKILSEEERIVNYAGGIVALNNLVHHVKLNGDYKDYGLANKTVTAINTKTKIIDSDVSITVASQRGASTDTWMIIEGHQGHIITTNIREA